MTRFSTLGWLQATARQSKNSSGKRHPATGLRRARMRWDWSNSNPELSSAP